MQAQTRTRPAGVMYRMQLTQGWRSHPCVNCTRYITPAEGFSPLPDLWSSKSSPIPATFLTRWLVLVLQSLVSPVLRPTVQWTCLLFCTVIRETAIFGAPELFLIRPTPRQSLTCSCHEPFCQSMCLVTLLDPLPSAPAVLLIVLCLKCGSNFSAWNAGAGFCCACCGDGTFRTLDVDGLGKGGEKAGRLSLRDGNFGGGVANAVALDGLGLWSHSWFHGV